MPPWVLTRPDAAQAQPPAAPVRGASDNPFARTPVPSVTVGSRITITSMSGPSIPAAPAVPVMSSNDDSLDDI